jgi:hypothetical protein
VAGFFSAPSSAACVLTGRSTSCDTDTRRQGGVSELY